MHRTVRGQRPRLSFGWCVVGLWTLVCLDLNVGSKLSYAGATDTKGHKNRHGKPGHDVISKPSRHLHAVPTKWPDRCHPDHAIISTSSASAQRATIGLGCPAELP